MADLVNRPLPGHDDGAQRRMDVLEVAFGRGLHSEVDLNWLYRQNPVGPAVECTSMLAGVDVGYAAAIPQRWRTPDGTERTLGAVVNIAVTPAGRGRGGSGGLLRQLGVQGRAAGWASLWGASNAPAIGGLLKEPTYCLIRQMDTYAVAPGRRADRPALERLTDSPATWLETVEGKGWVDELEPSPRRGVAQVWDRRSLAWRLSRPDRRYVLYRSPRATLIAVKTLVKGIPVAVIVKVLAHRGTAVVRMEGLIDAVRAREHAVIGLYTGWNARVPPLPNRVPRRLLPSGLSVGNFDLSDGTERWDPETCELLDGDQL